MNDYEYPIRSPWFGDTPAWMMALMRLSRYGGSIGGKAPNRKEQARKCAANRQQRAKLNKHRARKAKSDKRHGRKAS